MLATQVQVWCAGRGEEGRWRYCLFLPDGQSSQDGPTSSPPCSLFSVFCHFVSLAACTSLLKHPTLPGPWHCFPTARRPPLHVERAGPLGEGSSLAALLGLPGGCCPEMSSGFCLPAPGFSTGWEGSFVSSGFSDHLGTTGPVEMTGTCRLDSHFEDGSLECIGHGQGLVRLSSGS